MLTIFQSTMMMTMWSEERKRKKAVACLKKMPIRKNLKVRLLERA